MASQNKDRIVSWIILWPMSAFLFVFSDLLTDLFGRLYNMIGSVYESLTQRYLP